MSARAAELQREIARLSAQLLEELRAETAPPAGAPPPYLSIERFAARLGVSARTVRRMIVDGLPAERVRVRIVRIPVQRAEQWIAEQAARRAASVEGMH